MEFNNSLNWDLVLRRTYFAVPNPAQPKGFVPIPTISVLVDRYTLAIGAKSNQAKANWHLAGYACPRLLFSPSSTSDYIAAVQSERAQAILLNQLTLVQFRNFSNNSYLLTINVPRWLREVSLEIWKYQGSDNTQSITDSIAEIKIDVERIETKIDNYSTN